MLIRNPEFRSKGTVGFHGYWDSFATYNFVLQFLMLDHEKNNRNRIWMKMKSRIHILTFRIMIKRKILSQRSEKDLQDGRQCLKLWTYVGKHSCRVLTHSLMLISRMVTLIGCCWVTPPRTGLPLLLWPAVAPPTRTSCTSGTPFGKVM